jgi:geranylgeranyl diphosphate synthase type I
MVTSKPPSSPVDPFVERYLPRLEAEMQAVVDAPSPAVGDLYGYLRYHLGWVDAHFQPLRGSAHTGKRIRPTLCLLACEGCHGDWEQALPAAAAIELVHNFSLIHDDIEDGDETRRGRPTVWSVWGMPQALNAGDALYTLAHLALLRLADRGVPTETVLAALSMFHTTCLRLTEGQFLDIGFETRDAVSPEEYLHMVEGKTAALLATTCELGALIARAPARQRQELRSAGHYLGLAFQMQDDILGIWGDPQQTGKPVGSDLIRRKKTFPILHGLRHSQALQALLARPTLSQTDVEEAVALLEQVGSREWTQRQAETFTHRSLAALDGAALTGPAAEAMLHVVSSLLGRAR